MTNAATAAGIFRIGGEGVSSPRFTAAGTADRIALVDRYLAERQTGVIILEVKRDDRSWDEWKRDLDSIEFMRAGVNGAVGAAEYLRAGFRCADPVVRATHNAASVADLPRVPYDSCVSRFFPPDTVVPLDQVRRLMIDFALHCEWSTAAPWRAHSHLAG